MQDHSLRNKTVYNVEKENSYKKHNLSVITLVSMHYGFMMNIYPDF